MSPGLAGDTSVSRRGLVQLVWDMPDTNFIGFVVAAFGGEELSVDLASGYTFTFKN